MRNNYLFILMFAVLIGLNSCSKDGLIGPEGPEGKPGAVGAAGKDGSVIYSGTGAPGTGLGTNGDYYLDKNTAQLYGPKTASGWGSPTSLMGATGATGAAGANGSTTLSGNGTPSNSLGANGDYYLDKTNYLLYGPKTSSGWGIPILLRGADGAQGPTGAAGKDGSIIYSGNGTPSNAIGVNGDYYLDKTTANLYGPKTTSGWGSALGLKGTNGTNGTNGSTTLSGTGAPSTGIGAIGDYYLDKASYQLYGPKDAGGWGVPILLRGAAGPQGPMGPAGADGTIIYSGNDAPDPSLGKIGDFYIAKNTMMMYGPKNTDGWGPGTSLRGSNGNTILSGRGTPNNSLGVEGDFYLDLLSYTMYGPKGAGGWGAGTSIKGADGGGGNVMAYETADAATFSWVSKFNFFDAKNYKLRMSRNVAPNDTTTVFSLPAPAANALQNGGSVAVYVRIATVDPDKKWMQLAFTNYDTGFAQFYSYNLTNYSAGSSAIRIFGSLTQNTDLLMSFDKVRIVVTPATTVGIIGGVSSMPMPQLMQKFNLEEKDFVKLN